MSRRKQAYQLLVANREEAIVNVAERITRFHHADEADRKAMRAALDEYDATVSEQNTPEPTP